MTIEKGKEWGTPTAAPSLRIVAHSDHELALMPLEGVASVVGGDIWHALGKPTLKTDGVAGTLLSLDALVVTITANSSSRSVLASSCVQIGHWIQVPFFQKATRYICITNAGVVDERSIAPRAHPNDGKFDVMRLAESMDWRQRLLSYKRAASGTHVPHPLVAIEQSTSIKVVRESRNEMLRVDHMEVSDWESISVAIAPDHWNLFV